MHMFFMASEDIDLPIHQLCQINFKIRYTTAFPILILGKDGGIVVLVHRLFGRTAHLLHVLDKSNDDLRQGSIPAWVGHQSQSCDR